MLAEKIIPDNVSEKMIQFKEWTFSYPNSPDYEVLSNEDKLVIEYKGKRIAEFTYFLDRLHVQSWDCRMSIGANNMSLKCSSDELHRCLI